MYPRIYDKSLDANEYYRFYTENYVQRDVRLLKNIGNLDTFIRFLKLCAGRIGQLLNLSSLANDAGVSVPTAKSWLSVLEASYIAYTLKPYHSKFSKRLVKTPKLYFYDTGLACSLLGVRSAIDLESHFYEVDYLKISSSTNSLNRRSTELKNQILTFGAINRDAKLISLTKRADAPTR